MSLSLPKAVFFDWDGTLVDTMPLVYKAHNHVHRAMGYAPLTDDELYANAHHSARALYPRLYDDKADEAMEILYRYIEDNHLAELRLMAGAADLVATVQKLGVPLGVVSNKTHKYLLREIEHLGWQDLFANAIGAGHAVRDKPSPEHLLMALDAAGFREGNSEIWYIGDREADLELAHNTGCTAILVSALPPEPEWHIRYPSFLHYLHCKDLHKAIISL